MDVVVLAMLVVFVTAITIVRGISSTFQHKSIATTASSFHLAATTLSNLVSIFLCDHDLHFENTAQKMSSTSEASSNLNTDACGFVHLADDGVCRSYAANSSVRLVHNQVLFGYLIDLPYKASSNRIFNIPCNLRHRYLLN